MLDLALPSNRTLMVTLDAHVFGKLPFFMTRLRNQKRCRWRDVVSTVSYRQRFVIVILDSYSFPGCHLCKQFSQSEKEAEGSISPLRCGASSWFQLIRIIVYSMRVSNAIGKEDTHAHGSISILTCGFISAELRCDSISFSKFVYVAIIRQ